MKFAVRFSLSLTLVVLLAMVNAEPKTYMIETRDGDGTGGDTGSKGESLVSLESLVSWEPKKSLVPPELLGSLESLESLVPESPEPLESLTVRLIATKLRIRYYKCGSDADPIHIGFEGVEREGGGSAGGRGQCGNLHLKAHAFPVKKIHKKEIEEKNIV